MRTALGILLGALATTAVVWPQASQVVAIRAGRLFDSNSGKELSRQVVLIQGKRISEAGPEDQIKIPPGAQVIDLSQATVLPGEKGKYADIIAVSGDPLQDITELQRVKFAMKGGKVVRNDLMAQKR